MKTRTSFSCRFLQNCFDIEVPSDLRLLLKDVNKADVTAKSDFSNSRGLRNTTDLSFDLYLSKVSIFNMKVPWSGVEYRFF
jgi:hypothetical protein